MLLYLLLLFTVMPIVELYLLIELGKATSAGTAIAVVLVTGVIGAASARHEGFRTYTRINRELNRGQIPADALIDAVLILIAGVVLITPGMITDALGFCLLIPPLRSLFRKFLRSRFKSQMVVTGFHTAGNPLAGDTAARPRQPSPFAAHQGDDFVDVEAEVHDDKP
jgi:UPF0716 protein FxsA